MTACMSPAGMCVHREATAPKMGKGGRAPDDPLASLGGDDLFALMGMKKFSIMDDPNKGAAANAEAGGEGNVGATTDGSHLSVDVECVPRSSSAVRVTLTVRAVAVS